jgi:regulator of ribonuclease activity A
MSNFKTADLSDRLGDKARICAPIFRSFGGRSAFCGEIATVKCFEDNSLVKDMLSQPGDGRVLVVDAGGSERCAMLGDQLAQKAIFDHWAGIVMYGYIRDSADIAKMSLGIRALGTHPMKSVKRGAGEMDVPVTFGGVEFRPGDLLYADVDGILVVSAEDMPEKSCN